MDNYFLWTEICNCGKIGKIALDSFHKFCDLPVHVYGKSSDFDWITPNKNNIFINLETEWGKDVIEGYKKGHSGTATLWGKVMLDRKEKYMIHFDSDVIFRANLVDEIIQKSKEGYDLIGSIRNYKHNPHNRKDIIHQEDITGTECFLFNRQKIPYNDYKHLKGLCGGFNPTGKKLLDFFDAASYVMLENGAKIYHLDFDDVGGWDVMGSRDNKYKDINNGITPFKISFGEKLAHFSGVGSGMNFYENKENQGNVSSSYVSYCLDRYLIFCKIFYNETLDNTFNYEQYNKLLEVEKWY